MRLAQPQPGNPSLDSALAPAGVCAGIEATYVLRENDGKAPERNTVYFVSDIEPLLSSSASYEADVSAHSGDLASLSWVVLSFVNGRGKSDSGPITDPHTPPTAPVEGTVVVANGSTPRPDMESDYHAWYDEEHGAKLGNVPGWQMCRRYKLEKVYGGAETANFYGVNFYDEVNGLGGPEWKAGVTDWTLRIRDQAAKPNIRRVWKVVSTRVG
jgi:hypothetical protein